MQNFERDAVLPPACLSDERSAGPRAALVEFFGGEARRIAQTRIDASRFVMLDPSIQSTAENLFLHRCAFCESAGELYQPYRFRPIAEAGPSDAAPREDAERRHLYYTWLANAWQNVYPICSGCRPSEASIFPVMGRRCRLPTLEEVESYAGEPLGLRRWPIVEHPLFLDPCANEDFRRHLAALPNGELVGLSARGESSIAHFDLNRPLLRHRREQAFDRYFAALLAAARNKMGTAASFDFKSLEYGGGWFLLLYQLARKLGGGGGARPTLSRKRIDPYFAERFARPDFVDRVEQAFVDMLDRPRN